MWLIDCFEKIIPPIYAMPDQLVCEVAHKILNLSSSPAPQSSHINNLSSLRAQGFYNEPLFTFLQSHDCLSLNGIDRSIAVDELKLTEIDGTDYLLFGASSTLEFHFGLKRNDSDSIYEITHLEQPEPFHTFHQFILIRYFFENADRIKLDQALQVIKAT